MAPKGKYHDIEALLESDSDTGTAETASTRQKRPSPAIGAMIGNKRPTRVTDTLRSEKEAVEKNLKDATDQFHQEKSELLRQLETLQSKQIDTAQVALTMPITKRLVKFKLQRIDPSLIDISPENERIQDFLDDVSLKDILPSIKQHGQQKPGTVRPKENGRYELIEGSRRLVSVKLANQEYLALVGNVPDADVRELSNIENKHQDVSPYEKALAYQRQINNGEYTNWTQLGAVYGISSSHISRYKACVDLDSLFVRILSCPSDMPLSYGETISNILKKNKKNAFLKAQELLEHRDINSAHLPSADEVIKILKNSVQTKSGSPTTKKPISYISTDGKVSMRHSISNKGNTKFELIGVTEEKQKKILTFLMQTLKVEHLKK